jgi:hypothetical protein
MVQKGATLRQAADAVGVSVSTLQNYGVKSPHKSGRRPSIKEGKPT